MSMRVTPAQNHLAFTGIKYNEYGRHANNEIEGKFANDAELNKLVGKTKIEVTHGFSGVYTVVKKNFLGLVKKEARIEESEGTYKNITDIIKGLLTKKK